MPPPHGKYATYFLDEMGSWSLCVSRGLIFAFGAYSPEGTMMMNNNEVICAQW